MALGFVFTEVPGATPKNPFSGLIALKLPGKFSAKELDVNTDRSITYTLISCQAHCGSEFSHHFCFFGVFFSPP